MDFGQHAICRHNQMHEPELSSLYQPVQWSVNKAVTECCDSRALLLFSLKTLSCGPCMPCSDKAVTGYSIYNVAPDKVAQYFNKIQCFCFEEQRLRPGEVGGWAVKEAHLCTVPVDMRAAHLVKL